MRPHPRAWLVQAGIAALAATTVAQSAAAQSVPFDDREIFPERVYHLGDDPLEASAGMDGDVVGTHTPPGDVTLDSIGPVGTVTGQGFGFLDANPQGQPVYRDVQSAPGGGQWGAELDGQDDYIWNRVSVNAPTNMTTQAENAYDEQGGDISTYPFDYSGIFGRGMQAWVKPSSSNRPSQQVDGETQYQRQMVIADGNQHKIYIDPPSQTEDNKWRWGSPQTGDADVAEGVVDFDQTSHVMRRHTGNQAVLWVNGEAVAVEGGTYNADENTLVIGADAFSRPGTDEDPPADPSNPFKGTIGKAEVFIFGSNEEDDQVEPAFNDNGELIAEDSNPQSGVLDWNDDGHDFGDIDLNTDNEWIAKQWQDKGVDPASLVADADIDMDGELSGDADLSTEDDVSEFVENWRFTRTVDETQFGDWVSRQKGDLNYDGEVDLLDWQILSDALIAHTGSAPSAAELNLVVPEPASLSLLGLGGMMLMGRRRSHRRRR